MDPSRAPSNPLAVVGDADRGSFPAGETSNSDAGLLDYAWVILHHWRLILGVPLSAALVTVLLSVLLPQRWSASIEFVPETSSSIKLPSGLGNLAGELGIALPNANPLESPAFYAKVLDSRPLLESTLLAKFPVSDRSDSLQLLELLRIRPGSYRERVERGIKRLRKLTSVTTDNKTSVLRLEVETQDAVLSAAVANHMVRLLNDFNRDTRTTQARERRRFTQARSEEAARELEQAEDALRRFLTQNRQFESPQLMFERNRLERQVTLRQEIYGTLRREYEVARIEEVNDTPVLTVVDPAVTPATRSFPQRGRMALVASVLGFVTALGLAFLLEYLRKSRVRQPAAYDRMVHAWRRRERGPTARGPER